MNDDLSPGQRQSLDALRALRGACPPAGALVEYESLTAEARAGNPHHPHIQICSRCQLALLHMATDAGATGAARATGPRLPSWVLPLAAVVVLGVAVTMIDRRGGTTAPPDTIRGTEVQLLSPSGAIDAVTEFSWQSPIRAERYRVTVRRDGDTVWQVETEAQRIEAPRNLLQGKVEYRWTVDAIDREGDVRMTSPPQSFVIR